MARTMTTPPAIANCAAKDLSFHDLKGFAVTPSPPPFGLL
jgi:hypothetical protein